MKLNEPAPDLFYVFGDGADHLLADIHRMVTTLYTVLVPPEKRHTPMVGCPSCGVGPEDECSDDCPTRHGDFGEDEPNG